MYTVVIYKNGDSKWKTEDIKLRETTQSCYLNKN